MCCRTRHSNVVARTNSTIHIQRLGYLNDRPADPPLLGEPLFFEFVSFSFLVSLLLSTSWILRSSFLSSCPLRPPRPGPPRPPTITTSTISIASMISIRVTVTTARTIASTASSTSAISIILITLLVDITAILVH
jgi:hypothetical protein